MDPPTPLIIPLSTATCALQLIVQMTVPDSFRLHFDSTLAKSSSEDTILASQDPPLAFHTMPMIIPPPMGVVDLTDMYPTNSCTVISDSDSIPTSIQAHQSVQMACQFLTNAFAKLPSTPPPVTDVSKGRKPGPNTSATSPFRMESKSVPTSPACPDLHMPQQAPSSLTMIYQPTSSQESNVSFFKMHKGHIVRVMTTNHSEHQSCLLVYIHPSEETIPHPSMWTIPGCTQKGCTIFHLNSWITGLHCSRILTPIVLTNWHNHNCSVPSDTSTTRYPRWKHGNPERICISSSPRPRSQFVPP